MSSLKFLQIQYKSKFELKTPSTKELLVLVFLCMLSFLYTGNSYAYNIEPAIEEFTLEVYDQREASIKFTNTTQEAQEFKVYSHRYNPETEEIIDDRDFVHLTTETFPLEPNESKDILYEIIIPDDALSGSYFSIIVIEQIQPQSTESNSVIGISYGIGSLIAIHVKDDTDISEVFVTETTTQLKYTKPLNPLSTEIEYKIKNNSKYTFLPTGQLAILSPNEQPVFYQINPEETKLYPESELTFTFNHEGNIKDLLKNKIALARVGTQFPGNLRENQIELSYFNQTLTIAITFIVTGTIFTTFIILARKKSNKKLKLLAKKQESSE